jgi:hypothetical protein
LPILKDKKNTLPARKKLLRPQKISIDFVVKRSIFWPSVTGTDDFQVQHSRGLGDLS